MKLFTPFLLLQVAYASLRLNSRILDESSTFPVKSPSTSPPSPPEKMSPPSTKIMSNKKKKKCKKKKKKCKKKKKTKPPTSSPTTTASSTSTLFPISSECFDNNNNCVDWARGGECEANPGYMLEFCKRSCEVCVYNINTGTSCASDSDCESNFCDPATNICYASDKCKAIRHSPGETFNDDKVVVVFVGSDFTNIVDWENQVARTFSRFGDYPFFGEEADYVAFYVNELIDSYCTCGCYNIDRLLCCEDKVAFDLAEKCFPRVAQLQVLAIHNDETYCGAGGAIATISTNEYGPVVAVHEIGHSLFNLQDEYDWDYVGSDNGPNCDSSPGCPRWADLIPHFPDICKHKGCGEGDYFISEKKSFMNDNIANVGPVLRRFTCCTYYAITGQAPSYCDDLVNLGDGLYKFCENSGYSPALSQVAAAQSQYKKSIISTPSGTFTYISHPFQFIIAISSFKENNTYFATFAQLQGKKKLPAGFYGSNMIYGDQLTPERATKLAKNECIKVDIQFESGIIDTRYYLTTTTLHAPPGRARSKVAVPPIALKVPKSSITVIVKESFDPITQATAKFECL